MTDILVIGGGMAGISAGARLAEGAGVTVLEAEDSIGHHSTGRSAAMFLRNYGNRTLRALNAASALVFDAPGEIADGPLLSARGELLIATEDGLDAMEAYLDGAEGMSRLSAAEALEHVPILRAEGIAGAAYEPDAQDIDVDRMLQGFRRLLTAQGGKVVTRARVEAIRCVDGCWEVETGAGCWRAQVLVNAAGAWADGIAEMAGVTRVGLVPMRRSAAILPAPEGHDVTRWPLFGDFAETWYARPDAGRLMVSPADEDPVEPHDVFADDMVLAEGLHRFEQAVTVPVTRVGQNWAGLRTFAPDRTPVVGFAPDAPGFFWLAGQGGYGIQTAPALARLAADLVVGYDPALSADVVASLSPARFSDPERT
ncbi:FAD-binding oxidoreductase [Maritimibacter sp. 55A14]|uniref:NAD(P)/FAD-dependent oxidoreductase n=1 Tax=Maritimibacter sp. 55A14 TaxID=2174844 RepID=UPI0021015774|nr:FAD-binding oxidoreductase [Maritimibacter sp. 55A14]